MSMTPEKYAMLKAIKAGTVIRLNGTMRVVRRVDWRPSVPKRGRPKHYTYDKGHFYFVIKHCSWTRRPYTTYTSTDLASMRVEIIGHNVKLKTPAFDAAFLAATEWPARRQLLMTCCDVHGMP